MNYNKINKCIFLINIESEDIMLLAISMKFN